MSGELRGHIRVLLAGALGILVSGCAIGTTRVRVYHRELSSASKTRQGKILVKRLVDKRDAKQQPYIGNKRNGFGMVLGHYAVADGQLEDVLTRHFADALSKAGYEAQVDAGGAPAGDAQCDAILEGDIDEFWLDMYMRVWHKVSVALRAKNPKTGDVLWTGRAEGNSNNMLWLGINAEIERAIADALTPALDSAVQSFGSEQFYGSIKKQ